MPSKSFTTLARAISSSAVAEGTGRPSASLWVPPRWTRSRGAGGQTVPQQGGHMVDLFRRLALSMAAGPITTRRRAEWPTEKPALRASAHRGDRGSPLSRSSPRAALLERFEGHALDLGQHAHEVAGGSLVAAPR